MVQTPSAGQKATSGAVGSKRRGQNPMTMAAPRWLGSRGGLARPQFLPLGSRLAGRRHPLPGRSAFTIRPPRVAGGHERRGEAFFTSRSTNVTADWVLSRVVGGRDLVDASLDLAMAAVFAHAVVVRSGARNLAETAVSKIAADEEDRTTRGPRVFVTGSKITGT